MADNGNSRPPSSSSHERISVVADAPSRFISGLTQREYDMYEAITGFPPKSLAEVEEFKRNQARIAKEKKT